MTVARAAGVHLPWEHAPEPVRRWAEQFTGPVREARTQPGGMSPGCVVRLAGPSGRVFVKAVGTDVNPRTPQLYRHEAAVLCALPPAPHRPALRDVYDDGTWVALVFEDVEGRYPDLRDPGDAAAVRTTVARQSRELAGVRPEIDGLDVHVHRWLATWRDDRARAVQPAWLAARHSEFADRLRSLPERVPPDQLIHWDIRNDNLLIRPDGTVMIFDWGMSRLGPTWADLFLLALHHADDARFDRDVATIGEHLGVGPDAATADDILVCLGTRLAWMAVHAPEPGIPAITAFRQREAARLFTAAQRRLS